MLGGAKQQAVLATLLLRAGEVVTVERLVDSVWGEDPPASAHHSLEAYVSRLRRVLSPHQVALERVGRGYRVSVAATQLDFARFEHLLEEAEAAGAAGAHARASELARNALGLWRGAPLAGLLLEPPARGELERLEELRLAALETSIDADLALGRHGQHVGELRPLVEANPYRERLVSQLMIALYRSGRQAEALAVYERARSALADDLGLRPSEELQGLSAEIVRHDRRLATPGPVATPLGVDSTRPRRPGLLRLVAAVTGIAAVIVGTASIIGGRGSGAGGSTRVALVLARVPEVGRGDRFESPFVDGLLRADREYDLQTNVLALGPFRRSVLRVAHALRTGHYDLVLSTSDLEGILSPEVHDLPGTKFVFIDAALKGTLLAGSANATGFRFEDEDAGLLAGYLSGLVVSEAAHRSHRRPVVSVVAGAHVPAVTALVRGFTRGAHRADRRIVVQVEYSETFEAQASCEAIANRQIDRGSTLVYAPAGECGFGGLSAAALRGVWGVGADADLSYLGSHILASTVKRNDRAVLLATRWFVEGSLPGGKDVPLGMDDEAVGIAGISPEVSPRIRRKVARLAEVLRQTEVTRDVEPTAPPARPG
jgi:DNA-binding SARP family transcriptional activator/basic membrane lipoprotein Med (substrate-binding protein (PBP1-ABC) superfamily)